MGAVLGALGGLRDLSNHTYNSAIRPNIITKHGTLCAMRNWGVLREFVKTQDLKPTYSGIQLGVFTRDVLLFYAIEDH